MIEVAGVALAVASILPVASRRVETCVTTSLGLGALCLLGVSLATGVGYIEARWWLLAAGVSMTSTGAYLQGWHTAAGRWLDATIARMLIG